MSPGNPPFPPAEHANVSCYGDYYDKPSWWFALRYDTQIKRKTCLHLIGKAGRSVRGQRVLDIGFGSGATLFSFDESCEVCGIELSRSALQRAARTAAAKGYRRFEFRAPTGDTIPFEDSRFDIVIASHVLEHVRDDRALLLEIRRVLADRGIAVALIPINERYDDPNHVRRYTPQGFQTLVGQCGLTIVDELQNELLFHFVERFYFAGYNKKWPLLGPAIVAVFNLPTALLPFRIYRGLERALSIAGLPPRQAGFVLRRDGTQA